MESYKTIESEIKYRGHIVEIKQDLIMLPDGKTASREIVLRGEAAAVLPVCSDGDVILIKQYRHSVEKTVIEIPAGMMNDGETDPMACALREIKEETGYTAGCIKLLMKMHTTIGFCTEVIYIYEASDLTEGETNLDDEEFIEILKIPADEAVNMIYSGEITDSKAIAALLAHKNLSGC